MSAKFFRGEDYDEAIQAAEQYYNADKDFLNIEVFQEGNETDAWMIIAMAGDNADMAYRLSYEDEGVFLEIYPENYTGTAVNSSEIDRYISRKNLSGLNGLAAMSLMRKGAGRAQIASAQDEVILDEDIIITVAKDEMSASIQIQPPDKTGERLDAERILARLVDENITYGIDSEAIFSVLQDRVYYEDYPIAHGKEAVDGKDGRLEFLFRRELSRAPKKIGEDKVDFRSLDIFEPVSAGQLLVKRVLPTPGELGFTVRGRELVPKPGRDAPMPRNKNCIANEENTELYAACGGSVSFEKNTVVVTNIFQVNGDCDMGIGNIDFDGSVMIKGNVITGMSIKASGDIIVNGHVEASDLTAGGDIEVKQGVNGMDRGTLTAGGSIVTTYIDRATASAGEDVTAELIRYSVVTAEGYVNLPGKRANIMGSTVRATKAVTSKVVGSLSHAQTEIEVGMLPKHRERMIFIQGEMENLTKEFEKIQQLATYLSKTNSTMSEERKKVLKATAIKSAQQATQLFREYTEELDKLKKLESMATEGKVHVLEVTYPGVRIKIGNAVYRVNDEIRFATFKLSEGDVIFTACEAR